MKAPANKPYDIFPPMQQLKANWQLMDSGQRNRLKTTVALMASDPRAVALYVDIDGDDWLNIYPPKPRPAKISTGSAIDKFIETYGKTSPDEEELLERLIFNPVPEYGTMLAQKNAPENPDGTTSPDDGEALARVARQINSLPEDSEPVFAPQPEPIPAIVDAPAYEPQIEAEIAPQQTAQSELTIELVKIFVKQGQFQRAKDIISKIILNNPEKSVYFADQLRFLDKLIRLSAGK